MAVRESEARGVRFMHGLVSCLDGGFCSSNGGKASVSAHRPVVDTVKSWMATRELSVQCWALFMLVFGGKNMSLSIPSRYSREPTFSTF